MDMCLVGVYSLITKAVHMVEHVGALERVWALVENGIRVLINWFKFLVTGVLYRLGYFTPHIISRQLFLVHGAHGGFGSFFSWLKVERTICRCWRSATLP